MIYINAQHENTINARFKVSYLSIVQTSSSKYLLFINSSVSLKQYVLHTQYSREFYNYLSNLFCKIIITNQREINKPTIEEFLNVNAVSYNKHGYVHRRHLYMSKNN